MLSVIFINDVLFGGNVTLTRVYGHTALRPAANMVTLVFRPVYEMTVTLIERVYWCMHCVASADLLNKQCSNMVI